MDFTQFKAKHGAGRGFAPGAKGSKYDSVVSGLTLNIPAMVVKPEDSDFSTNKKYATYLQALGRKSGKAIQQVTDEEGNVWVCWVGDFVSKPKKVTEPAPIEA